MKQSSVSSVNYKKKFQIVLDPESYATAERCGYNKAIFEGEEIKGKNRNSINKIYLNIIIIIKMAYYLFLFKIINYQQ